MNANSKHRWQASCLIGLVLVLLISILMLNPSSHPPRARAQGPDPTPPASGQAPSPSARQMDPPLPIPRHRVGHLAKVDNLDVLLEQGQLSDPLAGNYTLVNWDRIAMVWQGTDTCFNTKIYTTTEELDSLTAKAKAIDSAYPSSLGQIDVAAGYLGGTTEQADIVAVWSDYGDVMLGIYEAAPDLDSYQHAQAYWVDRHSMDWDPVRVATGDLDGDAQDEIVIAFRSVADAVHMQVCDTHGGLYPDWKGSYSGDALATGSALDVATGDFNGDGVDEIALIWLDNDTHKWSLQVFSVDQAGTPHPKARYDAQVSKECPSGWTCPPYVSVAVGDFDGDGVDDITTTAGFVFCTGVHGIFKVADALGTLQAKWSQNTQCAEAQGAAGDLDGNGVDEAVLIVSWPAGGEDSTEISVYVADSQMNVQAKGTLGDSAMVWADDAAVGDLNQDLRAEIVLVGPATATSPADTVAKVYQVSTDLLTITPKGSIQDEQTNYPPKVALGGFDGKSLRVGPPTYTRVTQAKKIIAAINEPPKHYDVIGGTTYDVNDNPNTYARYENVQKSSTTMGLTTSRDWGVSTETGGHFWFIHASLTASYGQHFEKTTTSFKQMEFGQDVWAQADDAIVRTETNYDIWEYPVYADASDLVHGHLMVVFPVKTDPACTSNCQATMIATIDGKNPLSFYAPDHEPGNVFSYPIEAPGDISVTIKSDTLHYLGNNPYEMWVSWSDVKESETKKSSSLSIDTSIGFPGFSAQGHYGQEQISTQQTSFETDTDIHIYFDSIDPKYSYQVRPFLYWAKPDRHLVLDYGVALPSASPPTWWENTYNKPDPAFNLPWRRNPPTPEYQYLSKEITFDPASPTEGDRVTVRAKVRNYSLVSVDGVVVYFYNGDPDAGGTWFADSDPLSLPVQSSATAVTTFDTLGHNGQQVKIYARVDANTPVPEMHTDNNKAYAILPVKNAMSPSWPATLTFAPDGIAFDPETPGQDQTVHITATVEARGNTYTHVTVSFWDGDPRKGGTFIGGDLIYLMPADTTAPASIPWDTTGLRGEHDIWVNVGYQPGEEDISTDNWAHRALTLPPYQVYLPLCWKDGA